MTTAEVLREAKARIDKPEKWWQSGKGAAREAECALTALPLGTYGQGPGMYLIRAARHLGYPGPAVLNDETNHKTVMEMYDLAIAKAEGR